MSRTRRRSRTHSRQVRKNPQRLCFRGWPLGGTIDTLMGRMRRVFGVLLLMVWIGPPVAQAQVVQKPAGPPPTPAHTGVKAMLKGVIGDFRALPGKENLFIAAVGGAAALAVHPADESVNAHLVGKGWAKNVFAPGATI